MNRKYFTKVFLLISTLFLTNLFACGPLLANSNSRNTWPIDQFYAYDTDLPLNATQKVHKKTDAYTVYYFEIDSRHDKRVPGYYSLPAKGDKPYPLVVLMSGYGGSKNMLFQAVEQLSAKGCAAMALDPEYHGDRKVPGKDMYSKLPYSSRDAMIQTVIDYKRGIDFMGQRDDINIHRVGYIGGSMGGIIGAALAAEEPRLRAVALAVGGADWGYLLKHSVVAEALGLRKGAHPLDIKLFRRVVAPADPINLAQLISPRPVLMLNAKHDILVNPGSNKLLYNRLKEPKIIVWFNEDHDLGFDNAYPYIDKFFNDYLIGDKDPAKIGAQVLGNNTKPFNMKRKKPLPPPRTAIPLYDLFAYESFLPLVPDGASTTAFIDGATDFVFLSTHDKKVTGHAVIGDRTSALKGAVIYVHEVNGDKNEAEEMMKAATDAGYMFVAFDLEYHGGRAVDGRSFISKYAVTTADAMLQTTFDIRRAIDFTEQVLSPVAAGKQGEGNASFEIIVAAKGLMSPSLAYIASVYDKRIDKLVVFPGDHESANVKLMENLSARPDFPAMTQWIDYVASEPERDGLKIYLSDKVSTGRNSLSENTTVFKDIKEVLK